MIEELQQIDTSAIEELRKIKQDEEVLKDWLAKMEAKKGKVSDAVFARVRKDYEGRNAALDEKARPLKERARSEYAKLRSRVEQFEKALEVAKLDKEELEFRHEIGEFEGSDFEAHLKECEQRLTQRQAELTEANQLKGRFIEAFRSEEELALPPPAPAPAPAPAAAPPPGPAPAARPGGPTALGQLGATQSAPPPPPVPKAPRTPPPPRGDATIVIRKPMLLAQLDDGSAVEYPLELQVTSIGRAPDNKIRLQKDAVSRKHAQVVLSPKGYSIVDLKSENGTFVNGKRVTEHLLADGDAVQIGTQKLIYREG